MAASSAAPAGLREKVLNPKINKRPYNMLPEYIVSSSKVRDDKAISSDYNMVCIQAVNNKLKPDGHPENATITHHDLFHHMVHSLKLELNSVR